MHSIPVFKRKSLVQRAWFDVMRNWQLYLLILIPLAILILFKYAPMYGVQIAFRDFKITRSITSGTWVGLEYFTKFFDSPMAWTYIGNTLAISLYELCTFPLSLVLALLLNYLPSKRYRKAIQMISYAPHFISTVVMCGIILQFLQARGGLINVLLNLVGIESRNWITYPSAFRHIYVWSGVWQGLGYSSIIYLGSITGISDEYYEAAVIDGATKWQQIVQITLPFLKPMAGAHDYARGFHVLQQFRSVLSGAHEFRPALFRYEYHRRVRL